LTEDFSIEKFKVLLRLLEVKEGTIKDISKKTGVSVAQLSKVKPWLLKRSILVSQGNIFIKASNRNVYVEFFLINKKAIDYVLFKHWEQTKCLFDRAHEYIGYGDIEDY
jgi:uncharacterized protein YbaP (TraB family)